MSGARVKRVAVIGAGPAGAIAVDALAREKAFDVIRMFERREGPGGCWIGDAAPPPKLRNLAALADGSADRPLAIPATLPAQTPAAARTDEERQPRFAESSVYPYLETNVEDLTMEFSQEPIPAERSALGVALHGPDTPFRPWQVLRRYVQSLLERSGYPDLVAYGTWVERVEKVGAEWKVTLRKPGVATDYWWVEWFDAVVVANGHYWVPYVPHIEGLDEFEKARPGSVLHSKHFRGRQQFRDKRVVVVGASVSAADIAVDLAHSKTAQSPVHAITIGHTANGYFGDEAFKHPQIREHPSIARVDAATRTVHLIDGQSIADVDHIVFGTGYTWSLPFLPQVPVRHGRVPGLYQHVVWHADPTLAFVGAVAAGLTFKIFEWQAVLAARVLAGRASLPSAAEMRAWEDDRARARGDGIKFCVVNPDFEEYFETVRRLAGEGQEGVGRKLPEFRQEWLVSFNRGHERRKAMWKRLNAEARAEELLGSSVKAVARL
ncbi:hypothetical protein B0T26DRAFT_753760 [Lasiosphaeria miniovina]|uniref:Thiol-specific monooxygenase n=1 Tax=Lasiosphaeria miniovina TaxID=1954250 RepID=A0AA40AD63_9PEZI|nr:uncharacterized protein B0T26DRAFT_753760 [Lasiosphaeria miniovina]KAK0713666.1 hypothetical protein B0T26DRAFT_753760 [Lasiosphaeria miniovina]